MRTIPHLDPDDLVTIPKGAELAGIGVRTLWRWIGAGVVPVELLEGRRTLIRVRTLSKLPVAEPRGRRAPAYGSFA